MLNDTVTDEIPSDKEAEREQVVIFVMLGLATVVCSFITLRSIYIVCFANNQGRDLATGEELENMEAPRLPNNSARDPATGEEQENIEVTQLPNNPTPANLIRKFCNLIFDCLRHC